jgi:hypothetical protein
MLSEDKAAETDDAEHNHRIAERQRSGDRGSATQ